MPLFGKKRFKKAEKEAITALLNVSPPSRFVTSVGTIKNKDTSIDFPCLLELANRIFGFNGWSHSVIHQTIDFIEQDGDKYDVGVSALVKVMLKDGTFHEDVGYGVCRGLKCKGSSLSKARRAAANDGLRNALNAFGKGVSSTGMAAGKITDFLLPSEVMVKNGNATRSSVKRKLVPEFDSIPPHEKKVSSSYLDRAFPSTSSQGNTGQHSPMKAQSVLSPPFLSCTPGVARRSTALANVNDTPSTTDDSMLASPLAHCDSDSASSTPNNLRGSSQTSASSNKEKLRRKLKQLELEIKSRESARLDIMLQIANSFSPQVHPETTGMDNSD